MITHRIQLMSADLGRSYTPTLRPRRFTSELRTDVLQLGYRAGSDLSG
jgi:hypothetical protein